MKIELKQGSIRELVEGFKDSGEEGVKVTHRNHTTNTDSSNVI